MIKPCNCCIWHVANRLQDNFMVLSALLVFAIVEVRSIPSYPGTLGHDNQKCPLFENTITRYFCITY